MNRQTLERRWDVFRQHYGIYLRVLEPIPDARLDDHPIAGMRTPAQLVVHTSGGVVRDIAQGIATGEIKQHEEENAVAATLSSTDEAIAYAEACWREADRAIGEVGDDELRARVATPWNMSFRGSTAFNLLSDEFLHHRGQLYVYARACGCEPPFLWSFDENAQEFAPRQRAGTS